ncbi:MAG: hypothetical protein HY319_06845 [Armatimonadetes bacterium]|nr:hypothetical protein [Armatimonadota bacterium]
MTSDNGNTKKSLFLIDGNGLAYRSFYAVPPAQNSHGTPINAVAGFIDMALKMIRREKPTHVAVAFDKGVPTERVSEYQDYNAQRVEMPEDLAVQLPVIEDFVRALGIPVFRMRGHEADDCIGTVARRAAEQGMSVLILAGDLELLQLVGARIRVLTFRRGISDLVIFDEDQVKKRFNLKPSQLADLRALAGDSSDNITGVPGIGEVTAKKLLSQYGSLENLLKSLHSLPAKWRNPLSENREQAIEFKKRASIRTDLALDIDWSKCHYRGLPTDRVGELFERLELGELLEGMPKAPHPDTRKDQREHGYQLVKSRKELALLPELVGSGSVSMLFLGAGSEMAGFAIKGENVQPVIVLTGPGRQQLKVKQIVEALEGVLADSSRTKYVHNLRAFLMQEPVEKLEPEHNFFDVAVASHVIDSVERNSWLDEIARLNGLDIPGEGELIGHGVGQRKLSEISLDSLADWAARRVNGLSELGPRLEAELRHQGMLERFRRVEMPMAWVFAAIERDGVHVEKRRLARFSAALEAQIEALESEIYQLADSRFDLEDSKVLAEVLFDRMSLTVTARPKNGAVISNDVLSQIAEQNPIGEKLRDLRAVKELKHSFERSRGRFERPRHGWFTRVAQFPVTTAERLLWMGPTAVGGSVATFNRLLSEIEGLPNPAQRVELRTLFMSVLVPSNRKGHELLGIGYAQLQLRLAAHLAQEKELIVGFHRGNDVESTIASVVHNGSGGTITDEMKQDAVDSVLGSIGAYRLARRTGVSPEQAAAKVSNYQTEFYARYGHLRDYFNEQLDVARSRGWVSSITGRRRNLPEISSRNSDIRDMAERIARNASIQSSAADLLKEVMVEVFLRIRSGDLAAQLVMQVRDELIFEVKSVDRNLVSMEVERIMERVARLDVPISVEIRAGKNLAEREILLLEAAGRT